MAKQLNVSLAFTANTNEAIAAIKNLQKELNGLATGATLKNSGISQLTPEIQRAMVAAGELQAKLEGATNLKTGKLDLSQFSDSLKKGGVSLQEYANQLNALGPAGRQAFTNLAQSIMQAEAPLMRCSKRLKEFGTTLANTAKWQISSSMLHGFLGTLQSAYGYAQDLNKSLNDIRIVTGNSTAEMERFAKMANRAARELSITTNEYAKASLIYFQQGDSQEDVMKKTAVTTKMANVTGQSAEVVSNQLTAIWNNFNKAGEESYSKYADILTKLGAATASSTDEIAGGLEKFAGVADQIGLSYEYAASALATITATSRESEDVVGTALKTIFARIQGLNLGETLDDGTTLNKYSQALDKVGISIFNQAGELKDMDDLLEEMADTWSTLSKDQQTALAQTVAGVRQYNQLMTLMNNWDVMDNNLAISFSAEGELDKQAEIYAESWEAARDRVQASVEAIYTKILDDDFFIDFLDGFANVIDGISGTIDAFGGLKGVLLTIGAIASRLFHNEMVKGLKNAAYNLKQLTPLGKKEQDATREQALDALRQMKSNATGAEGQAENGALTREVEMQEALMRNAKKLTDEELKQLQVQMDLVRSLDKRAVAAAKAADVAKQELDHMRDMNKIQAQMDAKIKTRTNAKSKGEDSFTDRAFKAAESGGRKTMVEQYYKKQKHVAEDKVRQAHGLDAGASLDGFENEVRAAFVNGIREAANADGASEIAQKVGKELEHSVSVAMSGAAKKMSEAMANARREVEAYDQQIDKAAKANATAKSLGSTAKNMSAYTGTGDDKVAKSAKELAALQETLKNKIMQTKQAAEQLAGSLGDEDMDIQLNDDIKELDSMERQLEEATLSAEELEDVLRRLNSVADSGDYSGMTIGERIQNAADVSGTQAEMEGTTNTQGENIDFTGHYDAAKKKAEADIVADASGKDAGTQKEMFDEKVGNSGGVKSWADGIANATSIVMGLGSAITSVQGAIDVFNNPDASNWDKFSAVMSVIIGLLPVMSTLFTAAGTAGAEAGAGMTAAMGPVGWTILAVVAAVAALTVAFIALSNAYNRDAINAKKATENAEKLAEASDKAKQQLDGIKKGFEAYDTAVEKLNNCVRGTDEWNAALKEVNDTVMGLLKSYPELLNQKNLFTRNADGMLEIDETKRDAIIEEAERQAEVAEAAALIGAARASEARTVSQNTDTKRQIGTYYSYDSEGYVDASVNAGKIMTENKDQLAGLAPEEFEAELRNLIIKPAGMLDSEYESMITSLMGYQSSIDSLVTATENAATQMDNATLLLANSALGDEHNATEIAAGAQAYEEAQQEIYDQIIADDAKNNAYADTQTDTARDIWRHFQEASGIAYELANNAIQGDDNNRVYAYIDETGKEQTYTIEYIAQTIAASEAMAAMGTAADEAAALLGQLSTQGTAFAAALGQGTDETSMANFLSGMTQEQLDIIGNSITKNEDGTMSISQEGLDALGVTEEQFAQLAETFGISVQDLTANLAAAQETVDATISTTDKSYFSNHGIDTSDMTIGEQKEFLNNRDSFNNNFLGADTYSDFGSIISQNADIDPEIMSEFMGEMGKIDLTAEDATEQVRALVNEYGIKGDAINNLINRVDELPKHFNIATDAISESISKVNDIVKGLETGDIISQKDYDYLDDLGIDMNQYFMKMSDGTWKLVGDAEAFANMVNSYNVDQLKAQYQDFFNNREQVMSEWGLYSESTLINENVGVYAPQNTHKARADYLQSFDGMDFQTEGAADILALDLTNENLQITPGQVETINQMIAEANAQELLVGEQIASTAQSVDELNDMLTNGEISAENYDKALQAAFENEIEAEGFNSEELNEYAEALMNSEDALVETREEANRLAIAHAKMERGINDLVDNWDSWNEALENGSEKEKVATMGKMKKAMSDIIGVDIDQISDEFMNNTEAMKLMEQAANGDMEALDALGPLFAKQYIAEVGINNEDFTGDLATLQNDLTNMMEQFQMEDIEIGTSLDTSGYAQAMTEMMAAAGTDIDTINNILAGMGFEPEVTYIEVPASEYSQMIQNSQTQYTDPLTGTTYTAVLDSNLISEGQDTVRVPVINGSKTTFKGSGSSAASSGAKKGGSGGGGGGSSSKPQKVKETKKSDIIDRYKEVEDQLDNIRDAQDKASKSADRLYGAARLKEMNKINKALEKEVDLLKNKKKEAEAYLKIDKAELEKAAVKNGVSFTFDSETGDITNYTSEMTKLYNQLHAAEISANADGDATEEEQEKIDKIQERIDTIKEALEQYEETRELIEDIELELQDKIYEIQDNNFEQLNYKFEIKMEISDNSLKWIEYQLEKMEDDFYRAAEAAALFFNILNQEETKYGQTLEQVKITTQQFAEAEKMYNTFDKDGNRLISQANYIEAMNQARDSYYDQLAALQEIDDAMMNYYSDTLDKASEELAKYTDQMDHLSGVLEYYNSLMTLMGKEKDYEKMGVILDGQLKVVEDKLAVSEAIYQMYAAEVKKYEDDIASGVYGSMSDVEKELFDKEYQAALQKANEAEEEFLSSAEATIEAWKAKMQNELDGFGRDLEKALTGGTSFDWLITTMERMNSLHEEYLTTTNKIYETNKLMNQAQKEIDKSSNSIAKRKLKDFIEQTKSLQNQTALSKFELDIQQAKYDLLLAEIALEEAQNAKSQVRLQRDSEGNFGYVYTADSSAIDDAQQKLQDAQNNLYNISLDGANKYAEQEVQIRQEMYDTLRELETQYQEGSFASLEEYETARDEAMSYYYDKLEQASNLYNVAISADASAAAEHILGQEYLVAEASFGTFADIASNWQFHLGNMKSDMNFWKTDIVGYVGNVISEFEAWETFCKEMSERPSLTNLANQVGDITRKSEELREKITDPTNGVIKALSDEFEAVQKVTGEYGKQREAVQGLITDIENYIKALDNKQKAEVGDLDKDTEEEEKQETSSNTSDKNTAKEASKLAAKELVEKVHTRKIGSLEDGWRQDARNAGYSEDVINLALNAINDSKPGAGYDYDYIKALELLDSYDTGGYTGNWDGSYGKLAMVHKKELILKEGDTANFLASMEVLERILSIIDLQSANAQYVGAINSPALKFTGQDTLEQNVHIEASFPNATDRNEIEEAFKDIVNLASQYANRK